MWSRRSISRVDRPAMRDKYLPLVDRVSDRSELGDVISDLVGELSALHIFVRFGDQRESPDQIKTSSLGATLMLVGDTEIHQETQGVAFAGDFDTNRILFLGGTLRYAF